ncbi:MAG: PKD domain-containing protein [Crocinitomicaceae bacterium]|nr:PKD domain-containing protein [Crocinitomicaceae bacterium]
MKNNLRLAAMILFAVFTANVSNAQTITTFPYAEDFESFATCGTGCGAVCPLVGGTNAWFNDLGDNLDWSVNTGPTSSGNTGPSIDLNPGTVSGKYLYVETSCSGTGFPSMTANLESPQIDLSGANAMQFQFGWHMYGLDMGTAHIDVSNDLGVTWVTDVIPSWTDDQDLWQQTTVDLSAWNGDIVIVRIRHITGANFTSDMAVDDILIYDLIPDDAGIATFINPSFPTCTFNDSVEVELHNYGTDPLTSVDIDWLWNATPGTQVNWTGTMAPGASETVYLGSVPYVNGDVIVAQTSMPNGVPEMPSGIGNDQSTITVSTGLSGSYTVGATGVYPTLNAAVADLNTFGVCGPVIFDVEDGIYNEQITLMEVLGMDATNTVTFQGLNADPSLATLEFAGTGTPDNFVVWMDGGDNYHFNNLTLSATGVTYGTVVLMQNEATNNSWSNNVIKGDANVSSTSTNMALVYSPTGTSIDSMNVFDNNTFEYGSYVMYSYGNSTTDLESGTRVTNNTMTGFYYRGLHMYYQNDMEISGNTFTPGPNYTGAVYRVYMVYADGALRVDNNRIQGMNYGYGIYMSNCDALNTNRGYTYNNFMHVGDTASTSTSYGIYMTACNNQVITFNSVNLESNGTTSRSIYVTGGNQNYILNNAFSNNGPGYGMYYVSGVTGSENNNIYVPNGIPFYSGGDIMDINSWQGLTSFDLASDTLDPLFMSSEDLHTCQDLSLDGGALPDTLVLYDIDGQMRDLNTPDIGADEFLGLANISFGADTLLKCSDTPLVLGGWEPASDVISYLWNTTESLPTIAVTSPGPYSVTLTTACGTANAGVYVEEIPDAVAGFDLFASFLTADLTNMSSGTIDSFVWDFGDGTSSSTDLNPTHLYPDTGVYIITLTVTGPCGSDVYVDTMGSSFVGIEDLPFFNSLEVYPNPNKGEFAIDFELEQGANVSFNLTNMQGASIWKSELGTVNGTHSEVVQLSDQSAGIYLLEITMNDHVSTRKIIIE